MKELYLLTTFLFSVGTVQAYTEPVIEKDKLHQIQEQLSRSEYFIHWQSNAGIYQSTNPKNSLHAVYTGQEISITPRNSQQQWSFGFAVKGVSADGRSLYKPAVQPVAIIDDGIIQFNHDNHYTVEYVNNDQGIRQNFIIQKPAVEAHKLNIQLQASEGWQTFKRSETCLTFKNKQQRLSYNDLKVWDAKGTMLPAHFSVQNNQVQIEVDVEKAVYPVTIDPIVLNGTPQNANTFVQSNQADALMGYKVSTAGDINNDGYDDIMLGAPGYINGQGGNGAIFIYYGSSRGINPTRYTLLTSNVAGGQYGTNMAGGGDVNGDGYDDIVTIAPTDSANSQGGISVYYGAAAGIETTPETVYGDPAYGQFGSSIAITKDVNGDLIDDIIVGSSGASHGQTYEGTVTLIYGGPWGISYTPWTVIESNQAGLHLGSQVSGALDINNDLYNDIVVGADNKIFVYFGGPAGIEVTPASSMILNAPGTFHEYALAGGGDINNDGHGDILIGFPNYSNGQSLEGAVNVYYGNSTGIDTIPATILEGNVDSTYYSGTLAFAGDINNDGFSDIVVGARAQNNNINQIGEGMAYVYYGRSNGINPVPASTIQSNQANALMGFSVDGAGDVNGDGYSDVLIGAMLYTNGQFFEGGGFVYHGGAGSAGLLAAAPEIESTASAAVKVFPNPVVNNLSVQLQGLDIQAPTYIQIMNVQGILVQSVKAGNIEHYQQSIDLSRLTSGIYFVIIQNGGKVFREKIIKQ
ncbi:T9SS type A sorting domain-containing protein [Chitinophaga oryziterrae]|uniref:T9SS type A sorting domain-containing protein n=1 Tax=Chitinophaga oryziterrae TaxID=1031224 RepID=A0A6N8JGN5_9BACT|nr:FG-GAP-like repeat-containing protein [Chitinophaga oryziterrae]MVT43458.1 T9SS type A sorting domain-containing protein [Chitinophaga oryziterrae]